MTPPYQYYLSTPKLVWIEENEYSDSVRGIQYKGRAKQHKLSLGMTCFAGALTLTYGRLAFWVFHTTTLYLPSVVYFCRVFSNRLLAIIRSSSYPGQYAERRIFQCLPHPRTKISSRGVYSGGVTREKMKVCHGYYCYAIVIKARILRSGRYADLVE